MPIEPRTLPFGRKNLFAKKLFLVISRTHLILFIKPTSRALAKERGLLQKKTKTPVGTSSTSWDIKKGQKTAVGTSSTSWEKISGAKNPLCLLVEKPAAEFLLLIKGLK